MDIKTDYNSNNYTIHVGHSIFETYINYYTSKYNDVFYLIDEYVFDLYKEKLISFENVIKVPQGESFKDIHHVMDTIDLLLKNEVKRNSLIVVIGGGATGDAGAFLSSILLRGVDYIHVPTTLLSHDSSLGGKTAINRPSGKNLVGTFYRPKGVIYDLNFLETLSDEELLSGFGEVVKHAMLNNKNTLNNLIEVTKNRINLKELEPFIISGIKTKMYYVTVDETESNLRRSLNLGHTLGHALEYEYKLKHGHAIILGLLFTLFLSNKILDSQFDLNYYKKYFKKIGYNISYLYNLAEDNLIDLMSIDKKNSVSNMINFVLLEDYGTPVFKGIEKNALKKYLKEFQEII